MFPIPPLCSGLKLVVLLICSQGIPLERRSSNAFMSSCRTLVQCTGVNDCMCAVKIWKIRICLLAPFQAQRSCFTWGKKKTSYFLMFSYSLVAQHSKISFPQITDETGNVEELEVSCGFICTSVIWCHSPQFSSHWALQAVFCFQLELKQNWVKMRRVVLLECYVPKFLPYMNEKKHNTLLLEVLFGWFLSWPHLDFLL